MIVMHENLLGYGVAIFEKAYDQYAQKIFSDELIKLLSTLHRELENERREILKAHSRTSPFNSAPFVPPVPNDPHLHHPSSDSDWKIPPLPADFAERRVEILLPAPAASFSTLKYGLRRSGIDQDQAQDYSPTFLLDLEDSVRPLWKNILKGIFHIVSLVENGERGKINDIFSLTKFSLRVRGMHLEEANLTVDGEKISAAIFDLTVLLFLTAKRVLALGRTPHLVIPKCHSPAEAKWWEKLFQSIEKSLDLPRGRLKVSLSVESFTDVFCLDEMMGLLRERLVGVRIGQFNKMLGAMRATQFLPRPQMSSSPELNPIQEWRKNFLQMVVHLCHQRGVPCTVESEPLVPGEMAELREGQKARVRKECSEYRDLGLDGISCFHPFFAPLIIKSFTHLNQGAILWPEVQEHIAVVWQQLLAYFPSLPAKTLEELKEAVRVGLVYQRGWNRGNACMTHENFILDSQLMTNLRQLISVWVQGQSMAHDLILNIIEEECRLLMGDATSNPNSQESDVLEEWEVAKDQLREFLFLSHEGLDGRESWSSELA